MSEDLRRLQADLAQSPKRVASVADKVIRRTALEIKRGMQKDLRGSRYFKTIAQSVDYDLHSGEFGGSRAFGAEIGPNATRDPSAALAGIAYFGGANGGGGTVRDPAEILAEQADLMVAHIREQIGDGL